MHDRGKEKPGMQGPGVNKRCEIGLNTIGGEVKSCYLCQQPVNSLPYGPCCPLCMLKVAEEFYARALHRLSEANNQYQLWRSHGQ